MKFECIGDILQVEPQKVTKKEQTIIIDTERVNVTCPVRYYKVLSEGPYKDKLVLIFQSRVHFVDSGYDKYYFTEKDALLGVCTPELHDMVTRAT